jgi:CelD/BcsL family acetyltransferase involved in cellulose biosynthesis
MSSSAIFKRQTRASKLECLLLKINKNLYPHVVFLSSRRRRIISGVNQLYILSAAVMVRKTYQDLRHCTNTKQNKKKKKRKKERKKVRKYGKCTLAIKQPHKKSIPEKKER